MGSATPTNSLPDQNSSSLRLVHPTNAEKIATWTLTAKNWGVALGLKNYLEREEYLTKIPLAKDNGVSHWILVDSSLPQDNRPILASCESLRKRTLVRTKDGVLKEVITHGIGSVHCNPEYRGKGYAGRMLKELGPALQHWQTDANIPGREECQFSFLYSDIGKTFYTQKGWHPFPSSHIAFKPSVSSTKSSSAKPLNSADIKPLCELDVQYIRRSLENAKDSKIHVALLPEHDQMQWHHKREDFMTSKLFGRSPTIKGAIAGEEGSRVWAIWTRSFYGGLDKVDSGNTFHILRLVIENGKLTDENAKALKGILELAQSEAIGWRCHRVELWNPTEYVQDLVQRTGLEHESINRESESIASIMWYGPGSGKVDEIEWVGNEKYGWC
ncbi:N-acetyltransferase-like protein [Bisporella sp. PMI_857]|nr:N-acetyltransferase-like protein [Bisporella sp. PMI_857]